MTAINDALINKLNYLSEYANITLSRVLKDCEDVANKTILSKHKYKIFFSKTDNVYCTYVPDDTRPAKRKAIKRRCKKDLEHEINKYYRNKHRKKQTLKSIYEKWLIYRRDYTGVKNKTIQENVYEWTCFVENTELAEMPIKEIRPIILIRFFRKLTKDREYSRKRVSNLRSVLNGVMTFAIEEEIIEHNPVADINFKQFTYKPAKNQSDNVFSREEVVKLLTYLATIRNEPYALAIQFAFYLFIRIGELKTIEWSDIDFEKRTVHLYKQALSKGSCRTI